MLGGLRGMLTEKKLRMVGKQRGRNPCQNTDLMTDQIAHTLCNQRAYSGEDSSRESERWRKPAPGPAWTAVQCSPGGQSKEPQPLTLYSQI